MHALSARLLKAGLLDAHILRFKEACRQVTQLGSLKRAHALCYKECALKYP